MEVYDQADKRAIGFALKAIFEFDNSKVNLAIKEQIGVSSQRLTLARTWLRRANGAGLRSAWCSSRECRSSSFILPTPACTIVCCTFHA